MVARGVLGGVVTGGKAGAGFGVGAVMGLRWMGSGGGWSGGLSRFRVTTVVLVLSGGGESEGLKTQPMAHAIASACKASVKRTAEKDSLRGMKGRVCRGAPKAAGPVWAGYMGER
jgi:hypothetical protein